MSSQFDPLKDYVDELLQMRKSKYEPDWYKDLHAYENEHFATWNRSIGRVEFAPQRKKWFVQFPEVKKQTDSFENLLLSGNPIYTIYPTDYSNKDDITQARYQSLYLRQHYLDAHEDNVLHELVHFGSLLPISFLEVATVKEMNPSNGKWEMGTKPVVYDAFDILFDARYPFERNKMIVKIIRTTPKRVVDSKLYPDFTDEKISSGEQDYKEMFFADKFGGNDNGYDGNRRMILYEIKIKEDDGIKIVTLDGSGRRLRTAYEKGMPFFDIVPFQPFSGFPYSASFAHNLIPINRSMDMMGNRMDSLMMKSVKGSYIMPQSTDVSMSDEDGTIMKYRGQAPTVLPPIPFPQAAFSYFNLLISLSERYGLNALAMGGQQKGSNQRSGKQGEQAIKGAMAQQKTPLDNLMYTMKRVAEVTMFKESRLTTEPKPMTMRNSSGEQPFVTKKFIGEDFYSIMSNKDGLVQIPKSVPKMTVEIEDESINSVAAKREAISKMVADYANCPEELKPLLIAEYSVGDTADLLSILDQNRSLLNTPEFQNLIAQARKGMLPPEVVQGIGKMVLYLSKGSPGKPEDMGIQSSGPKPGDQIAGAGLPQAPGQAPGQPAQPAKPGQAPAAAPAAAPAPNPAK